MNSRRPVLDAISKNIIELLQQDGRMSFTDISRTVGLSEAAVRQRVQRLVESGVMQITAVTNPLELGFARQALVGVRVTGDTREVADLIAEFDEVDYVVLTAGSFDLLVEVLCVDDEALLSLINDRLRAVPGVLATETFVYLRLVKQSYTWGTR